MPIADETKTEKTSSRDGWHSPRGIGTRHLPPRLPRRQNPPRPRACCKCITDYPECSQTQYGKLLAANVFAFDPLLRPHKPKTDRLLFHMWVFSPFEPEIL